MISIRHCGLYVDDLDKMEQFYCTVFRMQPICSGQCEENPMLDQLLSGGGRNHCQVKTSKLITEFGAVKHSGDMLELVKVLSFSCEKLSFESGMNHIAFGVSDIQETAQLLEENGGMLETDIYEMGNRNLCCFGKDPEGNWIELIQRNA